MSDPFDSPEPLPPGPSPDAGAAPPGQPPRRRGHPLLAWLVILVLAGLAAWRPHAEPAEGEKRPAHGEGSGEMLMQMQARYMVGMTQVFPQAHETVYTQAQALDAGSAGQRLRFPVLANELAGPDEALKKLQHLDQLVADKLLTLSDDQVRVKSVLARLFRDYRKKFLGAPSVPAAERDLLRNDLGWFGELALAPAGGPDPAAREAVLDEARQTFLTLLGVVLGLLLLGLLGFIGLMLFLALALAGRIRSGFEGGYDRRPELARPPLPVLPSPGAEGQGEPGASAPGGQHPPGTDTPGPPRGPVPELQRVRRGAYHGVYAETFAVWMVLYIALSLAVGLVPPAARLAGTGAAQLLSLAALAWPVLRGVPWRQVRLDLGLTAGWRPLLEPFLGVATYVMTLPLMALGMLITLLLVSARAAAGGADGGHQQHLHATPPARPQHHLDDRVRRQVPRGERAAVLAPVLEEIMFRGVLYRHLRDALGVLGTAASIVLSATLISFLFAVIHPQGLLAVPALMAVAVGLTLAREWRGTLVPGVVAHGLNNGLIMLLLLSLAG